MYRGPCGFEKRVYSKAQKQENVLAKQTIKLALDTQNSKVEFVSYLLLCLQNLALYWMLSDGWLYEWMNIK